MHTMCVRVCVHSYIYIHICERTHHGGFKVHIRICIRVCVHSCMHIYMCIHTRIHMYVTHTNAVRGRLAKREAEEKLRARQRERDAEAARLQVRIGAFATYE